MKDKVICSKCKRQFLRYHSCDIPCCEIPSGIYDYVDGMEGTQQVHCYDQNSNGECKYFLPRLRSKEIVLVLIYWTAIVIIFVGLVKLSFF